jgi:hypothetical protein
MAWHEQDNKPHYLFKLRLTKNLKRVVARLKEEDWQGCHNFGILQTAELKNQWDFNGFCSRYREVTENAARLLLVAYNTWNLFLRLLEPNRHVEAKHGRRWFLFISARLVKSQRQRTWKMAISGHWRADLMQGYQRVLAWLNLTAPQLKIYKRTLHQKLQKASQYES